VGPEPLAVTEAGAVTTDGLVGIAHRSTGKVYASGVVIWTNLILTARHPTDLWPGSTPCCLQIIKIR
jgi:hypothetical protein